MLRFLGLSMRSVHLLKVLFERIQSSEVERDFSLNNSSVSMVVNGETAGHELDLSARFVFVSAYIIKFLTLLPKDNGPQILSCLPFFWVHYKQLEKVLPYRSLFGVLINCRRLSPPS